MILIIGRGLIGSEIAATMTERKLVAHADEWQWRGLIASNAIKLVVNAAGIAGVKRCAEAGWKAVKRANVDLALEVATTCMNHGTKCLLLSSCGVYAKPHSTPKREDAQRSAPNDYIRSKIEMEDALEGLDVTIFRIPAFIGSGIHPFELRNRIRKWEYVQDAYMHLLYTQTLSRAVLRVADEKVNGIFNVADPEFQHVPSFVEDHYRKLPVWKEDEIPESFTLTHLLDTTKARRAGLL